MNKTKGGDPVKIRCKQEREGGTTVRLGETDYHFQPDATSAHVCDVTDREHLAKFLSIPEGYELAAGTVLVEDAVVTTTDITTTAPSGSDYNGLTRKQLEAAYITKFGRAPHPRSKDATLVQALIDG